ncbi:MAG: hypothetical protein KGJ36_03125 [Acidobacteriota bacterium]|nr:hypothetical protein [Acidobacteriota bacterium]
MPTVSALGSPSTEEVTTYLGHALGVRFKFNVRGGGAFSVKRSPMSLATVRTERRSENTTFRVHRGEVIITRLVNEMTIAKDVARMLSRWERGTPS